MGLIKDTGLFSEAVTCNRTGREQHMGMMISMIITVLQNGFMDGAIHSNAIALR